ncbi:hypothetical protein [Pedobacter arcticus]|uniref:hypothetical protein n=1 Tax=Pedobacter arcticus TaxID=752140 RepID=UPI0002E2E6B9|nr:hypothetical protein [Pedobacter arcticus]
MLLIVSFITGCNQKKSSSFYTVTLFYLHENSGDTILHNEALNKLALLEKEQYNTGTQDLGFMMYCSFGNAIRCYKQVLINSAKSLSSRFDPKVGAIRSW